MPAPAVLQAAAAAIRGVDRVIIGSHVDPDGDAIGSCLGLAHALQAADIRADLVLADRAECPLTYRFLPGSDRFSDALGVEAAPLFIALDCPELSRLGRAEPLARAAQGIVMIDHHPDASPEGTVHVFDPGSAATGALVWQLLPHLNVEPSPETAICTYTALLTDTGRFSYSNTTPAALRIAAEMVDAGADPSFVFTEVYESRTAAAQRLIGLTLERIVVANRGRVAYSWISDADLASTGAHPEETENLIDHVRALGGVDVVMLLKAGDRRVRGSLRAKRDADVGSVARALGGGGHRAAAGFTLDGDLEQALVVVLPLLPGGRE